MKIYITLAEAEQLIFDKILLVEKERLSVSIAKGMLSVVVIYSEEGLICADEDRLILMSSYVKTYEIAADDYDIFQHQYSLPTGLISKRARKVRDVVQGDTLQTLDEHRIAIVPWAKHYPMLRCAAVEIYRNILAIDHNSLSVGLLENLNQRKVLSSLQRKLLKEVCSVKTYPQLQAKVEGFHTDAFYHFAWWGRFVVEQLTESGLDQEQIDIVRKWLHAFKPMQVTLNGLKDQLATIPPFIDDEAAVLIGYYIACVHFNRPNANCVDMTACSWFEQAQDLHVELLFWVQLFVGLMKEGNARLYPVGNELGQFQKLDLMALSWAYQCEDQASPICACPFEILSYLDDSLVIQYFQLVTGDTRTELRVLSQGSVIEALKGYYHQSPLFGRNRSDIGFINQSDPQRYSVHNEIKIDEQRFHMTINDHLNNDIVFYGDVTSEHSVPKYANVKVKPFSALVHRSKQVLVGFINDHSNYMDIELYGEIIGAGCNLKHAVLVWELERDAAELHTALFEQQKQQKIALLEEKLGIKVRLIVKNRRNVSDKEVVRNLAQALSDVKLNEIELMSEGLSETQADWLVSATKPLYVRKRNQSYHYVDVS